MMNPVTEWITAVNEQVSRFVWGPAMLFCFLAVGLWFTVGTGFFQLTQFRRWMRCTILACFRDRSVTKTSDSHSISQFQSLCTVLAATTGTGNIAGIAAAITVGGPGAVFWMWLSSLLGMMTSYAENVLGIRYRYRNQNGEWEGGAMVYMERGLRCRWLALLFALFCMLASFGVGNMAQANSIAAALQASFHIPPVLTAVATALLLGIVVMGGIQRIARVTEKVVPFMSLFYIAGTLAVIISHIHALPAVLGTIFKEAFRLRAGLGGVAGYGMMTAMRTGISRGVFTNEAGLGSSVIVHAASDVKEPAVQGMWGIFEVFIDTIVVCTLTALAILTSGVYDQSLYAGALGSAAFDLLPNGAALTGEAFATVFGSFGGSFVSISVTLFAFSTLIGWSYYGEKAAVYLFGKKVSAPYQVLFSVVSALGCLAGLQLVWDLSDTFNGLMAIPNLAALCLLNRQVFSITEEYLKNNP